MSCIHCSKCDWKCFTKQWLNCQKILIISYRYTYLIVLQKPKRLNLYKN